MAGLDEFVDPRRTTSKFVEPQSGTLRALNEAMIYVDPDRNSTGYEDLFTRIAKC